MGYMKKHFNLQMQMIYFLISGTACSDVFYKPCTIIAAYDSFLNLRLREQNELSKHFNFTGYLQLSFYLHLTGKILETPVNRKLLIPSFGVLQLRAGP